MSGNEDKESDRKDLAPAEEQIPRADSSSSSVISRTSSPEHLEDDVFSAEKQAANVDPEQLSADIAARGILNPNKFSGDVPQSGIRGLLIAACDIDPNNSKETQETNELNLQEGNDEHSRDKHVSTGTEETQPLFEEVSFVNKDSSTSRPSSASSSSSIATGTNKREVSFRDTEEDQSLQKERSFISHTENKTVEVVSICTQTEWSWLKDMELYQETIKRSKPEWAERPERKISREVPKSPSGNISIKINRNINITSPPTPPPPPPIGHTPCRNSIVVFVMENLTPDGRGW